MSIDLGLHSTYLRRSFYLYLRPVLLLLAAILSVGVATGCGGDSDRPGSASRGGDVSFMVTGAIEEQFEGRATYTDASLALGFFSPGMSDNRTFALDLSMPAESGTPPAAGSYAIGRSIGAVGFSAQLNLFEGGGLMNPTVYRAVADGSGTLEITTSSDDAVEGTFTFDAEHEDGGRIAIREGRFRAMQVQGGMRPTGD